MNIDSLASWAQVVSVLGAILTALFHYERRLIRRLDKQDSDIERVSETLDRQFGTNGFVLHEKIKTLEASYGSERQRLDDHLETHLYLKD